MKFVVHETLTPEIRAFLQVASDELLERGISKYGVLLRKDYRAVTYSDRQGIAAAMGFELLTSGVCYIDLVHVRADRRNEGLYGKIYRALRKHARNKGASSVESSVAGKNMPMILAAAKAGRTIQSIRYSDPL
jgi:hypothetical protein